MKKVFGGVGEQAHRVHIEFIFRPSEPLPRQDFETATTTEFADIAHHENQKVFFRGCFCC